MTSQFFEILDVGNELACRPPGITFAPSVLASRTSFELQERRHLLPGTRQIKNNGSVDEGIDQIELWNREDASELQRPTDLRKYEISVTSRDWTVDTMVRQIEQGNIDLDPAFQRRNAWKDNRRSRLIESFILGFPVPQIVLAENPRHKGTFIVIDGKQRLMTMAGLYLTDYREYWNGPEFTGLDVLGDLLNGVALDRFLSDPTFSAQRRRLENADIRTTVITGFTDEDVLYDIFYRINTGSVPLSSQELRQVLNRGPFAKFLLETTDQTNPLWTVLGIRTPDPRLRDVELLLRLVAWRRSSAIYRGNMKAFLDTQMSALNDDWQSEEQRVRHLVEQLFEGVTATIEVFGSDVGRKLRTSDSERRRFNRALFEVQAYYFSIPAIRTAALKKKKALKEAAAELFHDTDFIKSIEATTKSIENYKARFGKYQQMLRKALGVPVEAVKIASSAK